MCLQEEKRKVIQLFWSCCQNCLYCLLGNCLCNFFFLDTIIYWPPLFSQKKVGYDGSTHHLHEVSYSISRETKHLREPESLILHFPCVFFQWVLETKWSYEVRNIKKNIYTYICRQLSYILFFGELLIMFIFKSLSCTLKVSKTGRIKNLQSILNWSIR